MGRLLAWQLTRLGYAITLFERDTFVHKSSDGHAAAYTAAGMLTPVSEADSAEPAIVELGLQALTLWPDIVASLNTDVDFHQRGSLIVAHPNDQADFEHFHRQLARFPFDQNPIQSLDQWQLSQVNLELSRRFTQASYIANEAWLSPPLVMRALAERLIHHGAEIIEQAHVEVLNNGNVSSNGKTWTFDHTIDCRGLGAKADMPQLRGVRGEVIWLHAPEVELHQLVRLMHPRYRIYIVPRAHHRFVIGATHIESNNRQPITVRSALELLSAAYSVHPGFAEANIIETRTNCRPALPDNLPQLYSENNVLRINGLYRHGFLLAPALANMAINIIQGKALQNSTEVSLVQYQSPKPKSKSELTPEPESEPKPSNIQDTENA